MLRVGICGAAGRMGRSLIKVAGLQEYTKITATVESSQSPAVGKDAGSFAGLEPIGINISGDINEIINDFDVLIDFSVATAVSLNIATCIANKKNIVIGTTNLSEQQKKDILTAAEKIAILYSPNMSVGVNLCFNLLETATRILGEQSDIDILEAHHRGKKDAPSGTALAMAEVIAKSSTDNLKINKSSSIRGPRLAHTIEFGSIRAGDLAGEHTVLFTMAGEQIALSHKAFSNQIFSEGALRAAHWISTKSEGLYSMQDVLGFNEVIEG